MIKTGKDKADQDLSDRIRVVRNLLLRARQRKNTDFLPDLRYVDLHERLKDLNVLLNAKLDVYALLGSDIKMASFGDSLKLEIEKAAIIQTDLSLTESIHSLEDHPYLRGSIHNLELELNKQNLADFAASLYRIWPSINDSLIVRSMLSIGYYGIDIGLCALGSRYYLGNNSKWHTILSMTGSNATRIKSVLPLFLKEFDLAQGSDVTVKLQFMIDKFLASNPPKDYIYYFIKYPQMLSENNLFAWVDDFALRNLNKNSLLGYHINPYVRTVAHLIKDDTICKVGECYGQYDEKSPIRLKNEVEIFSETDGWRIHLPANIVIAEAIKASLNIVSLPDNQDFLLKENTNQDRIEVAVEFIHNLVN